MNEAQVRQLNAGVDESETIRSGRTKEDAEDSLQPAPSTTNPNGTSGVPEKREQTMPPAASLLGLPGELKNMIYRQVLRSDDPIDLVITPTTPNVEPILLLVCKQIRNESWSIYYGENKLSVALQDLNPTPLVILSRACVRLNTYHTPSFYLNVNLQEGKSWKNLLEWLRLFHSMKVVFPLIYPTIGDNSNRMKWRTIALMFHITWRFCGIQWLSILPVIEKLRHGLIASEAGWN